jgi:hypothetical protein
MDLPALDNNMLGLIIHFLPWPAVGSLLTVNSAWRQSLESRDDLWLALQDTLEANWAVGPGGAAFQAKDGAAAAPSPRLKKTGRAPPPPRQSKRVKQSGRQKLAATVRARKWRSGELSTIVTFLLRKDALTVARLRKEIKTRMPVNLDFQDFSGFSLLNLVYAPTHTPPYTN